MIDLDTSGGPAGEYAGHQRVALRQPAPRHGQGRLVVTVLTQHLNSLQHLCKVELQSVQKLIDDNFI